MAEALQHSVLEALEGAKNYNAWVASLVAPYLGDDPIEIGSGTGTYADAVARGRDHPASR